SILFSFQIGEKSAKFASIIRAGGPAASIGIFLDSKPFHIGRGSSSYHIKTGVHTVLIQIFCARVGFQMLYLSPDACPHIRIGISLHAAACSSEAGKIILLCLSVSLKLKPRSEEHTSELQSRFDLECRLL